MPRSAFALVPPAASVPSVSLHRRRQQVVVRAAGARTDFSELEIDPRLHAATLPGLGFRAEADTMPALGATGDADDPSPVSEVRTRVRPCGLILPPPMPDRRRHPVTLLDDVHAELAKQYLEEAERLLASGIFDAAE